MRRLTLLVALVSGVATRPVAFADPYSETDLQDLRESLRDHGIDGQLPKTVAPETLAPAVPEPGTAALLALGLAILVKRRRR